MWGDLRITRMVKLPRSLSVVSPQNTTARSKSAVSVRIVKFVLYSSGSPGTGSPVMVYSGLSLVIWVANASVVLMMNQAVIRWKEVLVRTSHWSSMFVSFSTPATMAPDSGTVSAVRHHPARDSKHHKQKSCQCTINKYTSYIVYKHRITMRNTVFGMIMSYLFSAPTTCSKDKDLSQYAQQSWQHDCFTDLPSQATSNSISW